MESWTKLAVGAVVVLGALPLQVTACTGGDPDAWEPPPQFPALPSTATAAPVVDAGRVDDAASSSHAVDSARPISPVPTSSPIVEAGDEALAVATSDSGGAAVVDASVSAPDDAAADAAGAVCAVDNLKYLGELLGAGPEPQPCASGCPATLCCYLGDVCLPQ